MSRIFDVNNAVAIHCQPVCAPSWRGIHIVGSKPLAVPAIANCDVNRSLWENAAIENGQRSLVRMHMASKDKVDFRGVKQALHCGTHSHLLSLIVVRCVAVVPWRMQNGNDPWREGAVYTFQVPVEPGVLRRAVLERAIAAKHDDVRGAHIERVIQVARANCTAGN